MKKMLLIPAMLFYTMLVAQSTNKLESTGNAGVGTTDPTVAKLQVEHPVDGTTMFGLTVNGSGRLHVATDVSGNVLFKTWNYVDMRFGVNASDNLVIKNGGNIGIGTTSPNARLTITDGATPYAAYTGVLLDIKRNNTNGNDLTSAAAIRIANNSNGFSMAYGGSTDRLRFLDGGNIEVMSMLNGGNIGIGTIAPDSKLSVNGTVKAKKIIVSTGWSDYVFDNDYKLRDLNSLEKFIKTNKHLPDIPSAKDVEEKGISVGDNQALLLKKIEELTLYLLEQNKKIGRLEKKNKQQEKRLAAQEKMMEKMTAK